MKKSLNKIYKISPLSKIRPQVILLATLANLLTSLVSPSRTFAATVDTMNGIATLNGLEGIFQNLLSAVFALLGIVFFIMLIVGGFQYLTSGGSPDAAARARLTLTYAVIGVAAVAISYLILVLIQTFTGQTRLTNFIIRN